MNEKPTRAGPWTGALVALAVIAIGVAAVLWLRPSVADRADTISLPVVFRTPGGLLEVAGINTTESFLKRSMLTIAGMDMGTTVSQIQVPVTYRYHIELGKEWRAYMRDGRFLVIAPAIKPSLPVAIDTSRMQMQTQAGWLRFNGSTNLASLLAQITPELEIKARSSAYIEIEREQARKTVTEFATKWLITQERWKAVKPEQVKVYFADEPIEHLRSFGPEFAGSL